MKIYSVARICNFLGFLFLTSTWINIFLSTATFAQQSFCQSYFQKPIPATIKYVSDNEHRYYVHEKSEKQKYQVIPCKNGNCLYKLLENTPLDTTQSLLIESGIVSNVSQAMMVVDKNMNIYVDTQQIVGKRHHSTLVEGDSVLFAGMIRTEPDGSVLYVDYKSGHYKTKPYHLKWLLNLISSPASQNKIQVTFSDLIDIRTNFSFLPILSAKHFNQYTQLESDTGNHVLMRFLMNEDPEQFTSYPYYDNILEPAVSQWIRIAFNHKLRTSLHNDLHLSEEQTLNTAMHWIQVYLQHSHPEQLFHMITKAKSFFSEQGFKHNHYTWSQSFEESIDHLLHQHLSIKYPHSGK